MAGTFQLIHEENFTSTDTILINHGQDVEFFKIKVIINGEAREDLIADIIPDSIDPTNILTVVLRSSQTGLVQIFNTDFTAVSDVPISRKTLSIEEDGVSVLATATKINFIGDVSVTNSGLGKATVNIGGDASIIGGLHQLTFSENGSASNKWLGLYDHKNTSNKTLGIMPWKSKLVGISFTNEDDNTDIDVKIYSTPEGGGISPKTLDFNWQLRNIRTARKTNFATDIIFDAGDKIGLYLKDQGNKPKDVAVVLYFQITEGTNEESSDNFGGYFASGEGGGSS